MSDTIEVIRKIRTQDIREFAPSPYLKSSITNENGVNIPIVVRDYQKRGILNMCMIPKMCLGDDTGLGKTLQVLSTIGYVWLKEPEYVPIIVTTKSALFQWKAECEKFMQDMEPVVSHGEPHERNSIYQDFFSGTESKRLLLLTYDTLFRDLDSSVVKDKSVKASPADKKALKAARSDERRIRDNYESLASILAEYTNNANLELSEYVFSRQHGAKAKAPANWPKDAEKALENVILAKKELSDVASEVKRLSDIVAPPLRTRGIMDLMEEMRESLPDTKFFLVLDEVHKVKNYRSQVHEKIKQVSNICERIVGMTATPVKNRLMEFYGIYRIINPSLFPKVANFQSDYCVVKLQRVPGGRQVPIIVGYKNLDMFVSKIEPYFISRKKHEVAKELPELISMEVQCELSDMQDQLYDMAESGVGDDEEEYQDVLSSLVMCQQAVNAPQLLLDEEGNPFDGASTKIDQLMEMLENDLEDQKVIIFSRFEKMISLIETFLIKAKKKYVRITGKESDPKVRQAAREKFQDLNSGVNIVMITMAGSESLNLQAAEHFVFVDLPWSYGDHEQLIGRMIRIGSTHKTVIAHYMLGYRLDGSKTIDHHVLNALRSKKKLSDKVAGEGLKSSLELTKESDTDFMKSLINSIGNKSKDNAKPKKNKTKSNVIKQPKEKKEPQEDIQSISIDLSDI